MPITMTNHLSELDSLLAELNSVRYSQEQVEKKDMTMTITTSPSSMLARNQTKQFQDIFHNQSKGSGICKPNNQSVLGQEIPSNDVSTRSKTYSASMFNQTSENSDERSTQSPPFSREDLIHAPTEHSDDSTLRPKKHSRLIETQQLKKAPDDKSDDSADYDYSSKWDYLGKGIWENQDYGSLSNYSTIYHSQDEYDYSTLERDNLALSEEELEKSTGAGPRGDRSKVIETDHGEVQSKYRYMGFGLWENTDPTKPRKRKKIRPPPPPPKAQPIIYICTVSVTNTTNSRELDSLVMKSLATNLRNRKIEAAPEVPEVRTDDSWEVFEKEDMSDMFRRAMLEKMELVDDPPAKYKCCVCSHLIQGRIITAMGNKFHPQCFVCTYCRNEFKDRKYKTDPRDYKPYCFGCFEKLLGHYGNAHTHG